MEYTVGYEAIIQQSTTDKGVPVGFPDAEYVNKVRPLYIN